MGVYIKGMEMPKDNTVLLRIYPKDKLNELYVEQLDIDGDTLNEYWAVELPPHCRLIDADAEEVVVHCNNEENAKIIATILNMDADGYYLLYSSIFGEEEEPAPPKEEK